jgi:cell volume regulation protein A
LFLGLGMAVGSDGLGWIDFANYSLAHLVGTVALLLILFEGGLATGFRALRPVLGPSVSLAAIGTAGTALIAGLCASWLFHFSIAEGLLLGAILSPTDGAAVFALLRGIRLPRQLAMTLEGEAGLNDPVAVMLVMVMVEVIRVPGYGPLDAVWFLVKQLMVGGGVGLLVGVLATAALKRLGSAPSGLSLVASFATAAVAYGAAASIDGSGFLAVYLAGLAIGDADVESRRALLAFHEGLAAVADIGMFFALGLLVFPSQLGSVLVRGDAARAAARVRRPPGVRVGGDCAQPLHRSRTGPDRLGGSPRRGAGRARDASADRPRAAKSRVLQPRVLRGAGLDADPGRHRRAARRPFGDELDGGGITPRVIAVTMGIVDSKGVRFVRP